MRLRTVGLAFALLALLSCSDDSSGPVEPDATGPVTRTITPDGGTLAARADDGVVYTLTFPAGAVRVPTRITLRPLTPSGNAWALAALEPAGMSFYQPVDYTVSVPEGRTLSAQWLFFGDAATPTYLATDRDGNKRTLTAHLWTFGLYDGNIAFPASPLRPGASSQQGGNGNNAGAMPATCQQIHTQAIADYNALVNSEQFEAALRATLSTAAALQVASCPNVEAWIELARDLSCSRLTAVIADAQSTPISDYGHFEAQVTPIMQWAGQGFALDSECPGLDIYLDVMEAKVSQFVTWHVDRVQQLNTPNFQTYMQLKQEMLRVYDVVAIAGKLGLSEAAELVEDQAIPASANAMREVAYTLGKDHAWQFALTKLTTHGFFAGRDIIGVSDPRTCDNDYDPPRCYAPPIQWAPYSDEDLYEDIQFCGTQVSLQADAVSDQTLDVQPAGGEGSPGSQTDAITIDCPTRGTLKLDGTINTLTCFLTDEAADDEIVFTLAGKDVLTITRPAGDEYLQGTPAEIDIVAAAEEAGITPSEGTSHDLVVKRKRSNCSDDLWGAQEFTLLTATLNWKNPTLNAVISFPSQVLPGQPTQAEVQVEVIDQFGEAATFADIDVTLAVNGGAASTLSGRTDANGRFTTTITPFAAAKGQYGAVATVDIDAEARSFEGVTTNASKSALVGEPGTVMLATADRDLIANAACMGTSDGKSTVNKLTGAWSDNLNASSSGSTVEPPRDCSASASAYHTSDIVIEEGQLVEISGEMGGDYSISGSNLNFPGDALGRAYSHVHVDFEVSGAPVPFILTATGSGLDANVQVYLTGKVDKDNESVNIDTSGVLEPGDYSFRVDCGTNQRCDNCTATGNVSVTFSLKMGAAVATP